MFAVAFLAASCGGSSTGGVRSPSPPASTSSSGPPPASPSAIPSIPPVTAPYGVLFTPPSNGNYTVSLVSTAGTVAATAQASFPPNAACANGAAAVLPLPVSTSNSRLYYMDTTGAVRTLVPDGAPSLTPIITLPASSASRRSMFAVSPDDSRMAVVVADFTSTGATTRVYMDQLQAGGAQTQIFSEAGAYTLWPTGWHGTTSLVLAKVPACTQGGGPGCCGPQEFHVIDPVTAARRFTVGGSGCVITGPPTPAGALCATTSSASVISWTAVTTNTFPIHDYFAAYLSPNGSAVAVVDNSGTQVFPSPLQPWAGMTACGWIDEAHVLAGGDAQAQPRIGDATSGKVVPVAAQGGCAGRIPGGL